MEKAEKKIIGRLEKVDFLEIGLEDIDAKIDTGAYTSSLHCYDIEEKNVDGKQVLYIKFLDDQHPAYNNMSLHFEHYSKVRVRSSSGHLEERFKIKTKIRLGKNIYKTEFTLADRSSMKYPILLGRKILKNRFLVDVAKTYLLTTQKTNV